jgi:transcriptional regulator with XRE-family HTH domain
MSYKAQLSKSNLQAFADNGLSQKEVATRIGCSPQTVGRAARLHRVWFHRRVPPDVLSVHRLAALNRSIDERFEGECARQLSAVLEAFVSDLNEGRA